MNVQFFPTLPTFFQLQAMSNESSDSSEGLAPFYADMLNLFKQNRKKKRKSVEPKMEEESPSKPSTSSHNVGFLEEVDMAGGESSEVQKTDSSAKPVRLPEPGSSEAKTVDKTIAKVAYATLKEPLYAHASYEEFIVNSGIQKLKDTIKSRIEKQETEEETIMLALSSTDRETVKILVRELRQEFGPLLYSPSNDPVSQFNWHEPNILHPLHSMPRLAKIHALPGLTYVPGRPTTVSARLIHYNCISFINYILSDNLVLRASHQGQLLWW